MIEGRLTEEFHRFDCYYMYLHPALLCSQPVPNDDPQQVTMSQTATVAEYDTFSLAAPECWDHYIQYRPKYPDSMFAKWLAYHGEDEPLEAVHDLGTGGGVGAQAFLRALPRLRKDGANPVRTMYLSDPSEANLAAAWRNLTTDQFPGTTFQFHQGPGEEPNPDIAPGSLDLVMACECLHFTDIEPVMHNVARYLRPGGTFATIIYYAIPPILHNERARALQCDFERAWRDAMVERGHDFATRHRLQIAMGLDFVPLDQPQGYWQEGSVVRWYCNVADRAWPFDDLVQDLDADARARHAPRRCTHFERDGGTEKEEVVTDLQDWGMRGVTPAQMRELYAARQPGAYDDFYREMPEWKALEAEIARAPGGTVDVVVPAMMVMAKRK